MQLSIIILNYNVRYFLELCIVSVKAAIENLDAEIIVVDNNSSDDSCAMIRTRFPNIKLIENNENTGFPKGNNIGVNAASGEYICILNPDTVVAEDSFKKILNFIKNNTQVAPLGNKGIGIVGCKLIDGTGNFLPESKRGIPTPFVALTKIFGLYKISDLFGKYYAQHLLENQSGKVDVLVGAFMVIKKDLYSEIGGFDEKCFMYSDDIDLSYLVSKKGYNNYYFHETVVIHFKGESTVKNETYMKRFQEAMNFFYKKHFRVSFLFSIFMKIGIVLFSFIKKFQGKPKLNFEPENYILISNNINLKLKLESQLQKPIEIQDSSQLFLEKKNCEIIFDTNYINFKTMILLLEKHKNQKLTFKILPKGSNFIIGSNNSNDRGEVIEILDYI